MSFNLSFSDDGDDDNSFPSQNHTRAGVMGSRQPNESPRKSNNVAVTASNLDDVCEDDIKLIQEEEAALRLEDALMNDSSVCSSSSSSSSLSERNSDILSGHDIFARTQFTNRGIPIRPGDTLRRMFNDNNSATREYKIGISHHKLLKASPENDLILKKHLSISSPSSSCEIEFREINRLNKRKIIIGEANIATDPLTLDDSEMIECAAIFNEIEGCYVLDLVDFNVACGVESQTNRSVENSKYESEIDLVTADPRLMSQAADKQIKKLKKKKLRGTSVKGELSRETESKTLSRVSKSGFYGVYAVPNKKVESGVEYIAKATFAGKLVRLGKFASAIDAAKCYDAAVYKSGRRNRLNFPADFPNK